MNTLNNPVSVMATSALSTTQRKNRRPKHQFQVRHEPWTIQPFLIAPVIPGETLTNALIQSRVVTDPIKHPLIGWWVEYYYFYVKLRDLDERDILTEMMLDPAAPVTGLNVAAANPRTYHRANSPDFVSSCLKRIVECYFRDEGEPYTGAGNEAVVNSMPIAKAVGPKANFLESSQLQSALDAVVDNDLQNPNYPEIEGLDQYQDAYNRMRQMRMVDMTFDEWLATFGVSVRKDEQMHIPELLRYHREWSYPSNTIEPTTGAPSSAVSWSIADRIDKDRYFREPGFVFGVTVARPKIYMKHQVSSASEMMNFARSWMPALMGDTPWSSLRKYGGGAGPVVNTGASPAGDYWLDIRDLFMYGEQFVNFDLAATDAGTVALPKAGMKKHYVNLDDIKGLFVDPEKYLTRQDGVVDLTIKGPPLTTVDHT